MRQTRRIIAETVTALLVLALLALNFGHAAMAADDASGPTVTSFSASFCGTTTPLPAEAMHAPCHACRIDNAADLPPPPAMAAPVCFVATRVGHAQIATEAAAPLAFDLARPRAPPVA